MIKPIHNLFDVEFPLYISDHIRVPDILDIQIDGRVKYLVLRNAPRVPYDLIVDTPSTYLGRLMALDRLGVKPLRLDFSFTNIAHYVYGKPTQVPKDVLLIDNRGQLRCKGSVKMQEKTRAFNRRVGEWLWVKYYMPAIQIPDFEPLTEVLDTYKPAILLYEYKGTFYFKNICSDSLEKLRGRKVNVL